jgi:Tol biopolymer transport system component/DNA-binding winged helix-turn-helix (wHTH) protein
MSLNVSSNYLQNNFNAPKTNNLSFYEFEGFRLDVVHLMLYKNGAVVVLTPKQVETLVALVERRGEVVSKDELMKRLWGEAAVEESNLSQNLYVLRKKLGNHADGQPLIETFRRRGYRFNGVIRKTEEIEPLIGTKPKKLNSTAEEIVEPKISTEKGASNLSASSRKKFLRAALVAAIFGGILFIFGAARFFQSELKNNQLNNSRAARSTIKLSRLTPDLDIGDLAISPDGKYLAYNLNEKGKQSLWVKDIVNGSASQILPPIFEGYGDLVFSPDGLQIYYTSRPNTSVNRTIFRISAFGGEPQAIGYRTVSPLAISPDGKQIAFVEESSDGQPLVVTAADGSGKSVLRKRSKTEWYESWGSNLSWSPDGTRIAICGAQAAGSRGRYELLEVSLSDGSERKISVPDWNYIDDVEWLSDQSGLIVRARVSEVSPWQIWRVNYPNGEISRLTNDTNNYDDLSLSADSRLLVTRQKLGNLNIWTVPFDSPDRAKQITFGNSASDGLYGISYTPDGKILYSSPRGGNVDLWLMDAGDAEQKQLTKNAGDFNAQPRMTPDGRYIVFLSSRSGTKQIWRTDADGNNPQQLTNVRAAENLNLSPDGVWVYFNIFKEERHIIAKIPTGGGEVESVKESRNNLYPLSISPDGKLMFLSFYDKNSQQPWKNGVMSLETGELLRVFEDSIYLVAGWTPDSKSVICVLGNQSNLWRLPVDGGKPRQLTNFDGGLIRNFAVSPDFKQIAVSRGNPMSEAILISDF